MWPPGYAGAFAIRYTSSPAETLLAYEKFKRRIIRLEGDPAPVKKLGSATDPLWYKDAIIYEIHVRAFADSNNDGIGDFPGPHVRLDYLQDLGVTCLWLLPFFPSPLRDDGYDIADYVDVNPSYGTLNDFKLFLDAAHTARHAGDDRARHQPHLRPAPVVQGRPPRAARLAGPRNVRLVRDRPEATKASASSLPTPRNPTGRGTTRPRPSTGIASSRTSPTSISTIPASWKRSSKPCVSGSTWASMPSGSTPFRISSSATAPTARTCPRPTSHIKADPRRARRRI